MLLILICSPRSPQTELKYSLEKSGFRILAQYPLTIRMFKLLALSHIGSLQFVCFILLIIGWYLICIALFSLTIHDGYGNYGAYSFIQEFHYWTNLEGMPFLMDISVHIYINFWRKMFLLRKFTVWNFFLSVFLFLHFFNMYFWNESPNMYTTMKPPKFGRSFWNYMVSNQF